MKRPAYIDKPLAASGLTSYRYRDKFCCVMIGAKSVAEALREVERSISPSTPAIEHLEVWDDQQKVYIPCPR